MAPPPAQASQPLGFLPTPLQSLLANPATAPFVRAYGLGYVFSTFPEVIKFTLTFALSRRGTLGARVAHWLRRLARVLAESADPRNLAFASALALGGAKLADPIMIAGVARARVVYERARRGERRVVLDGLATERGPGRPVEEAERRAELEQIQATQAVATFLSSSAAALAAICLLQHGSAYRAGPVAPVANATASRGALQATARKDRSRPAYRQSSTLDLTLFLLVRACKLAPSFSVLVTGRRSRADSSGRLRWQPIRSSGCFTKLRGSPRARMAPSLRSLPCMPIRSCFGSRRGG